MRRWSNAPRPIAAPRRSRAALLGLLLVVPVAMLAAAIPAAADALADSGATLPTGRFLTAAAERGGKVYVVGGYQVTPFPAYLGDIIEYDPLADTAKKLDIRLAGPLGAASAVGTPAGVLVFGGWTGSAYSDRIYLVQQELGTVTWVGQLPRPLQGTSAVWTGTEAYIFGGAGNASTQTTPCDGTLPGLPYSKDIFRWVPGTHLAEKVGELSNCRQYSSAVWIGGKAYVFGGLDGRGQSDASIESWDPVTRTRELAGYMPTPRFGAAAAAWGGQAYLFAGVIKPGLSTPQIVRWDPLSRAATVMDTGVPDSPHYLSAAATPTGIALVGGWVNVVGPDYPTDRIQVYSPDLLAAGSVGHQVSPSIPAVGAMDLDTTGIATPPTCGLGPCEDPLVIQEQDVTVPGHDGLALTVPQDVVVPRTCPATPCTQPTPVLSGQTVWTPYVPGASVDPEDPYFDHVCVPADALCVVEVDGPVVVPPVGTGPVQRVPVTVPGQTAPPVCQLALCLGPYTLLKKGENTLLQPAPDTTVTVFGGYEEDPLCDGALGAACLAPVPLLPSQHASTPAVPAQHAPPVGVVVEYEDTYVPLYPNLGQTNPPAGIPIRIPGGPTLTICPQSWGCPVPVGPEAGFHGGAAVIVSIGDEEVEVPLRDVDIGA